MKFQVLLSEEVTSPGLRVEEGDTRLLLERREGEEEHGDLLEERELVELEGGALEVEAESNQEEKLKEIPCMDCDKSFPDKRRFDSHYWSAHKDPDNCSKCGKFFSSTKKLRRHMKAVHPEGPPLVCPKCGQSFKAPAHLKSHLSGHCGVVRPRKPRRTEVPRCVLCLAVFSSKADLVEHVRAEHSHLLGKESSFLLRRKFGSTTSRRGKRTWLCQECHVTFSRHHDFKRHTEVKHRGGGIDRQQGEQELGRQKEQEQPHQEELACGFGDCDFSCKTWIQLKQHKEEMHRGEKVYPCPSCPSAFTTRPLLVQHKNRRHRTSFFACPGVEGAFCGKTFRRSDHLKVHLKSCGTPFLKPWEDISSTTKARRARARADKFQEDINSLSGEERMMFLRAVAKNHPNLLEEATTIPLTMADILQVNFFLKFRMYPYNCLSI